MHPFPFFCFALFSGCRSPQWSSRAAQGQLEWLRPKVRKETGMIVARDWQKGSNWGFPHFLLFHKRIWSKELRCFDMMLATWIQKGFLNLHPRNKENGFTLISWTKPNQSVSTNIRFVANSFLLEDASVLTRAAAGMPVASADIYLQLALAPDPNVTLLPPPPPQTALLHPPENPTPIMFRVELKMFDAPINISPIPT